MTLDKTPMVLQIPRLDLQTLQVVPETELTFENTFLEYWLNHHHIDSRRIYQIDYVPEGHENLCKRLEGEGLYLAFINGQKGYVVEQALYDLMLNGNSARGICPILIGGKYSVHNGAAYGSLILSDGQDSRVFRNVKAFVLNDEAASLPAFWQEVAGGSDPLYQEVYARLGDGTLLLSPRLAKLFVPAAEMNRVHQFRAGTADYSGILKGTFQISKLCDYLNVDMIIGQNCVKMSDQELASVGLKTFQSFWINRKMSSQETTQEVGPQVQNALPQATKTDFEPRILKAAAAFRQVAESPLELAEDFLAKNQRREGSQNNPLVKLLEQDQRRVLLGSNYVQDLLQAYLRGQWKFFATHGIELPAAIAQPYRRLHPWEVANPQFPHGAILVYYRSPLVSTSALTVAINNLAAIPLNTEVGDMAGVAYLPPWTAKNVAITDFDGDRNAFFLTHLTLPEKDVPQLLRRILLKKDSQAMAELAGAEVAFPSLSDTTPETYYRAFQSLLQAALQQKDSFLIPAEFPTVLSEVVHLNAAQEFYINKAKKEKFQCEGQAHHERLWTVWAQLAENKIGLVSNNKMALDALANECVYLAERGKDTQVKEVYQQIRQQFTVVNSGEIPSDEYLAERGFVGLTGLRERITEILECQDMRECLRKVSVFFRQLSNTLVATNQQIAVDGQKSAQLIDEKIHEFTSALEYKKLSIIYEKDDRSLYVNGKVLEVNSYDPVSLRVQQINNLYQNYIDTHQNLLGAGINRDAQKNRDNLITASIRYCHQERFLAIKDDPQFQAAVEAYWERLSNRLRLSELQKHESRYERKQAYISVKIGDMPFYFLPRQKLFEIHGEEVTIPLKKPQFFYFKFQKASHYLTKAEYGYLEVYQSCTDQIGKREIVGVSAFSATLGDFCERFSRVLGHAVTAESFQQLGTKFSFVPANLCGLVPYGISESQLRHPLVFNVHQEQVRSSQSAANLLQQSAAAFRQESEERFTDFLLYLSTSPNSLRAALQNFPEEVCQKIIQPMDKIHLIGLQYNPDPALRQLPCGEYEFVFARHSYSNKQEEWVTTPSLKIKVENEYRHYGILSDKSLRLPEGTVVRGQLIQSQGNERVLNLLSYQLPCRAMAAPISEESLATSTALTLEIIPCRDRQTAGFSLLIKPRQKELENRLPSQVFSLSERTNGLLSWETEQQVFSLVQQYLHDQLPKISLLSPEKVTLNFTSHSLLRAAFTLQSPSYEKFARELGNFPVAFEFAFERPRLVNLEKHLCSLRQSSLAQNTHGRGWEIN